MATIVLNNQSFSLNGFNRNTVFNDDSISSYAYINIEYDNESAITLHDLAEDTITSLIIKNSEDEAIYNLEEISAKITNIDESLNGDSMMVNVNIQFNE